MVKNQHDHNEESPFDMYKSEPIANKFNSSQIMDGFLLKLLGVHYKPLPHNVTF